MKLDANELEVARRLVVKAVMKEKKKIHAWRLRDYKVFKHKKKQWEDHSLQQWEEIKLRQQCEDLSLQGCIQLLQQSEGVTHYHILVAAAM